VDTTEPLRAAFERHYLALREKCRRMLQDPQEADDVAQETFVRLWKSGLVGADERSVTAWVFRTSTRVAVDRLRSRTARAKLAAPTHWEESVESARSVDARVDLERVAASLPAAELEVLLLHRWGGLSHAEASEVTGRSERTVRRLLKRCEDRLAKMRQEALT
jgi:RNA polymerase sigma-70 factor (ECF subfamily)